MDKKALDALYSSVEQGKSDNKEQILIDKDLLDKLRKLATIGEKSSTLIAHPKKSIFGGAQTCPHENKPLKRRKYATIEDNQLVFFDHVTCSCGYEFCTRTVFEGKVL